MSKAHILVVEDDEDILELIRYNLSKDGYRVTCVTSGEKVLDTVRSKKPDAIVLDVMLPGMDGFDVCRLLKQNAATRSTPVLMLTAKSEEADIVAGLELGADDYITKPFSPRVLLARLKTALRRNSPTADASAEAIRIGDLLIDPGRHEVHIKNKLVELTLSEFRVLETLARKPGWVFSRDQIVDAVRGQDYAVTDRAVDVQIVGLRKKLGAHCDLIETVRGVGYRFKGL